MADDKQLTTLNGVQRAAVLLMAIGSDKAAEVLKHMSPKEVQSIGAAMANMQNIHRDSCTCNRNRIRTWRIRCQLNSNNLTIC